MNMTEKINMKTKFPSMKKNEAYLLMNHSANKEEMISPRLDNIIFCHIKSFE